MIRDHHIEEEAIPVPDRQTPRRRVPAIIQRLRDDWETTARSRQERSSVRGWSTDIEVETEDETRLVEAARTSDHVFANLLGRARSDRFARRVVVQAVLPELEKLLLARTPPHDREEAASRMLVELLEVFADPQMDAAGGLRRRLWRRAEQRVMRANHRDLESPQVVPLTWEHAENDTADPTRNVSELVDWVRRKAAVSEDTARVVVLTRAAGWSLAELAEERSLAVETLKRRRNRAEQRLRERTGPWLGL